MDEQNKKTEANLSRRLDEHVTPVIRKRLARFNEIGDWLSRLAEHIRFVLVLVFALACLCAGLFISSDAAQAIATGTGAILAGWAVLQLVRSDDAGFQTVEQQKRFLIAYATCLTGLKAQLEPIADRRIEHSGFQATFTPYLSRLDRFGDGEIAILMALSVHDGASSKPDDGHTGADNSPDARTKKIFKEFLDLRVMLGALVSNDPTLIEAICARFQSSVKNDVSVQSATELQKLLLDRVNSTLRTLKSVDTDLLRGVYAQMRRTTNFLGLIDASERGTVPVADRTLDQLASDIRQIFGTHEHPVISWYLSYLGYVNTVDHHTCRRKGSSMDKSHVLWLYQTHAEAIARLEKESLRKDVEDALNTIAERQFLRRAKDALPLVLSREALESLPAMALLSVFDKDHAYPVYLRCSDSEMNTLQPFLRPEEDDPLPFAGEFESPEELASYNRDRVQLENFLAQEAEKVREARVRMAVGKLAPENVDNALAGA